MIDSFSVYDGEYITYSNSKLALLLMTRAVLFMVLGAFSQIQIEFVLIKCHIHRIFMSVCDRYGANKANPHFLYNIFQLALLFF